MNAADLARLEVAKRAFRAVEPSDAEVQRGVRKARLSLRRPRQRRAWFSKTLVVVVLAMGGLAYAKPHALGEWVGSTLRGASSKSPKRGGGGGVGTEAALSPRALTGNVAPAGATPRPAPSPAVAPFAPAPEVEAAPAAEPARLPPQPAARAAGQSAERAVATAKQPVSGSAPAQDRSSQKLDAAATGIVASDDRAEASRAGIASEWGRVGEALARGDETRALAALKELSQSEDARTRDKADLGRAQLLMGNGHRDQACTMARSLSNRRAGGRIERQAQVLLKSCVRNNQ
jgi:hypothetical protein